MEYQRQHSVTCERGYFASGGTVFTCNEIGQLEPPANAISCNPLICNSPPIGQFFRIVTPTLEYGQLHSIFVFLKVLFAGLVFVS